MIISFLTSGCLTRQPREERIHAQPLNNQPHSRPRSLSTDSDAVPAEKLLLR
jgi:hypothetical protein